MCKLRKQLAHQCVCHLTSMYCLQAQKNHLNDHDDFKKKTRHPKFVFYALGKMKIKMISRISILLTDQIAE